MRCEGVGGGDTAGCCSVATAVEGALVAGFYHVVDLQRWFWCVWEAAWGEHLEVRDWGGEVRKLNIVAAFGYVPYLDFAIVMSGEDGSAVIADIETKCCTSRCRGQGPPV